MGFEGFSQCKKWLAPLHPTWRSKESRNRVSQFLNYEKVRSPDGLCLNVGSGSRRFEIQTLNLDLFGENEVDIQGDILNLPIKDESIETIICTGVLEHVLSPSQATEEIHRVLKFGGKIFLETPFMQTVHASPKDFHRWTPDGLKILLRKFDIQEINVVCGPATALAWIFQESMAMLFSLKNEVLYKIGLRIFGWLAVPISWLDIILESDPMAWHAASGYAVVAEKRIQ